MRALFDEIDVDGDGRLSQKEVVSLIESTQIREGRDWFCKYHSQTVSRVEEAFKQFDIDRNGSLEYGEFIAMMAVKPWTALLDFGRNTPDEKGASSEDELPAELLEDLLGVEQRHAAVHNIGPQPVASPMSSPLGQACAAEVEKEEALEEEGFAL